MLSVGEFAVVVDFECCGGFETGTCVEIVETKYFSEGSHLYECKSYSPKRQWSDLRLLHCDNCLHPIKATDACQEVHNEY